MTQRLHPGTHLDADQINIFLEGAATEHERAQMMLHLAECPVCRDVVFLAQGAEVELNPPAARPAPEPRRWWLSYGLAGAALAAAAVALVMYLRQASMPMENQQVAIVQRPAETAPRPSASFAPAQPQAKTEARNAVVQPERTTEPKAPNGAVGGVISGLFAANSPVEDRARPESGGAAQSTGANPVGNAAQPMPEVRATIAPPPATAPAYTNEAAKTPLAPAPQGGPAPALSMGRVHGSLMEGQRLSLRIVHDRGPNEGMGEVSGIVTDAAGATIPGASVSLHSADKTAREVATGQDGRFTIGDVPAGRYQLAVTARGFNTSSEQLELKSRDVAMLDSVLQVGSSAQTVTVTAEALSLQTNAAELDAAQIAADAKLPSGAAPVARIANGDRILSLDAAGNLYLSRNAGGKWKKIKPQWTGKAAQLALTPSSVANEAASRKKSKAADAAQVFELTTESGIVWISDDGTHWRPRR